MQVESLGIAAPCGQSFDTLPKHGSARFCASCNHLVVDLSALTQREAAVALRRAHCVSAAYDETGAIVFAPDRRRLRLWQAAVVAAPLAALACQPVARLEVTTERTTPPDRAPFEREPAPFVAEVAACEAPPKPPATRSSPAKSSVRRRYPRIVGAILPRDR